MDKNGFYFHECPTRSRFSHSSSIIWMSRFVIFVKPTCLFTFPSLWYHRAHAPCSLDFSHALSIFCTHYGAIPSTWFPMFLFDKISKKCIGVCSIFTIRFILACYTYIDKGIRTLGQGNIIFCCCYCHWYCYHIPLISLPPRVLISAPLSMITSILDSCCKSLHSHNMEVSMVYRPWSKQQKDQEQCPNLVMSRL